jgi:hypothetical protein
MELDPSFVGSMIGGIPEEYIYIKFKILKNLYSETTEQVTLSIDLMKSNLNML